LEAPVIDTWTEQDAKAQLPELLRRARGGEPQRIGVSDPCVVVSERDWAARQPTNLGAWLVESAPRGDDITLTPRSSRRGDPFVEATRPVRGTRPWAAWPQKDLLQFEASRHALRQRGAGHRHAGAGVRIL